MQNVTLEEAKKRIFLKHGENITMLEYNGATNKSQFSCSNNHIWYAITSSVWKGNGCKKCYESKKGSGRFSYEYVFNYISNNDCSLISKNYKNGRYKLEIQFKCGHIQFMSFECFKRGQRCKCTQKERFKNTISNKTYIKIMNVFKDKSFELIYFSDEIFNWNTLIKYKCEFNHVEEKTVRSFMRRKICSACRKMEIKEKFSLNGGTNWQGGKTRLSVFVKNNIDEWKKESMKSCGYKCVITECRFDDIHHLYSLNKIISSAFKELKIKNFIYLSDSPDLQTLKNILNKIIEIHYKYPLGVCLRKDVHILFHKIYGNKNNTPDQFYEFKSKIQSGLIILGDK